MSTTFLIVLIIIAFAGIIGGSIWIYLTLLKIARKAYWDLYYKVVQVEQNVIQHIGQVDQHIGQLDQQIGRVMQHVKQVEHHLLLEHLTDVTTRAKENSLIDADTYDKSIPLFHEMKMDNFQGKPIPEDRK